jgi:hypothetical protein
MSFDDAYDELIERISDRVVEKLSAVERPEQPEAWRLLTLKEAAERLTRSPSWLRERARRGDIPPVRLDGGALAFRLEDLRVLADSRLLQEEDEERSNRDWWREAS